MWIYDDYFSCKCMIITLYVSTRHGGEYFSWWCIVSMLDMVSVELFLCWYILITLDDGV